MQLPVPNAVRLVSLSTIDTKAGTKMTFANFANMTTYETLETRLALREGQTIQDVVVQRDYMAVVNYDGKYGSVEFTPIKSNMKIQQSNQ